MTAFFSEICKIANFIGEFTYIVIKRGKRDK